METFFVGELQASHAFRSKKSNGHRANPGVSLPPSPFGLNRVELLRGTGQWENMQEVLRRCDKPDIGSKALPSLPAWVFASSLLLYLLDTRVLALVYRKI